MDYTRRSGERAPSPPAPPFSPPMPPMQPPPFPILPTTCSIFNSPSDGVPNPKCEPIPTEWGGSTCGTYPTIPSGVYAYACCCPVNTINQGFLCSVATACNNPPIAPAPPYAVVPYVMPTYGVALLVFACLAVCCCICGGIYQGQQRRTTMGHNQGRELAEVDGTLGLPAPGTAHTSQVTVVDSSAKPSGDP